MPLIRFQEEMAVSGTATPLSGSQYEFLPWPAVVRIAMNAEDGLVVATVSSGSDVLQEEGPVSIRETAGIFPNRENFDLEDVAAAGDRLKIGLRNTGAGTPEVLGLVDLTPLI